MVQLIQEVTQEIQEMFQVMANLDVRLENARLRSHKGHVKNCICTKNWYNQQTNRQTDPSVRRNRRGPPRPHTSTRRYHCLSSTRPAPPVARTLLLLWLLLFVSLHLFVSFVCMFLSGCPPPGRAPYYSYTACARSVLLTLQAGARAAPVQVGGVGVGGVRLIQEK